MEELNKLEAKIKSLVALIKDLKSKNDKLESAQEKLFTKNEELSAKNKDLKSENAKLAKDNEQFIAKLEGLEGSVLDGSKQIEELNKEKVRTKMVVDDLIKSINDLVEVEKQQ